MRTSFSIGPGDNLSKGGILYCRASIGAFCSVLNTGVASFQGWISTIESPYRGGLIIITALGRDICTY